MYKNPIILMSIRSEKIMKHTGIVDQLISWSGGNCQPVFGLQTNKFFSFSMEWHFCKLLLLLLPLFSPTSSGTAVKPISPMDTWLLKSSKGNHRVKNLHHCLTILRVKKVFSCVQVEFVSFDLCTLPLVLPLGTNVEGQALLLFIALRLPRLNNPRSLSLSENVLICFSMFWKSKWHF